MNGGTSSHTQNNTGIIEKTKCFYLLTFERFYCSLFFLDLQASPRSPDFRNKETKIGLWINDLKLPSWVPQKLKEFDKEVKNQ